MRCRTGAVSLPELVLTLLLFGILMAGAGEFLVHCARLAAAQRDELRFMELARSARVILQGDLRALAPVDIVAEAADSVRLRAFRGGGAVCGGGDLDVWVRYDGIRSPDPTKDSVLLITSSGSESVRVLSAVSGAPCPSGLALRLAGSVVENVAWALVFESGAYHWAGGALRYRRGAGGRQPLTESLLEEPEFAGPTSLDLQVDLVPRLDSLRSGSPRPRRLDLRGLNATEGP